MGKLRFPLFARAALAFACLVVLAGAVSAQAPAGCQIGFNSETLGLFAISVAIMVFIVALIFMAAQLFKRPEWEAYSKVELHQVVASVLLLAAIYSLTGFSCEMSSSFAGGDPFTISNNYLNVLIYRQTIPNVYKLESLAVGLQYFAGVMSKYGAGPWGYQFPVFPGAQILESSIEFILFVLTPFTASLMVQQVGLQVIRGIMFTLVLPAGVLLRVFPQTRDAGVFLIATAFAFYVIFPMTYVMHAQVVGYIMEHDTSLNYASDFQQYVTGLNPANTPSVLDMAYSHGAIDFTNLFSPLQLLSYMVLQAIFLPALSMVITTTFIKTTTKFLGQKLD